MTLGESTLTAMAGIFGSAGGWLLCQADAVKDIIPEGIATGGALLTGAGFSVWYCYYVTKHVLPQKDKEHREAVKEIIDRHNLTVEHITNNFTAEMKTEREDHERNINRVISLARPEYPADASRPSNR